MLIKTTHFEPSTILASKVGAYPSGATVVLAGYEVLDQGLSDKHTNLQYDTQHNDIQHNTIQHNNKKM